MSLTYEGRKYERQAELAIRVKTKVKVKGLKEIFFGGEYF